MSLDNVDTTPSGDRSSYLMASNASLTDCFVMTTGGFSLANACSGETIVATANAVDAVVAMVEAVMDRSKKLLRVVVVVFLATKDSDVDDAAMETWSSPLLLRLRRTPPRPGRVDARPRRVEGGERHRGATDMKPLVNADVRKMSIADGSNDDLKRSMAEYLMVCG
jgi:hypothetical protein